MTLSDAIRLGSLLHPQGFHELQGPDGRTCALGAACEALGIDMRNTAHALAELGTVYPVLYQMFWWGDLREHIVARNDTFGWTRDAIAAWVESLEAQYSTTKNPAHVVADVS